MTQLAHRIIVIIALTIAQAPLPPAYAQGLDLPKPGLMVLLSPEDTPAHLVGLSVDPANALKFEFLMDRGDAALPQIKKQQEYQKLVKYFLASLTVPDEDQWVNLSPYEKGRIIKDDFGRTEMGRDLLVEDYILKQITSSLIYPEGGLGKKFWNRVYERAWKEYGTSDVPVNTFNKVWIIPDEALVYEDGNTAFVLRNHLKVMLEEDYLSLDKHTAISAGVSAVPNHKSHTLASEIVKEILLPELEKEVNNGRNFSNLRQIYSGMILAAWFKHALKESLLGKVYANKAKLKGVEGDPQAGQRIYRQYLEAYRKGVFNYIKEDLDRYTHEVIPRKYFSGGTEGYARGAKSYDGAMAAGTVEILSSREAIPPEIAAHIQPDVIRQASRIDRTTVALNPSAPDAAMSGILRKLALGTLLALPLTAAPAIHAQSREFGEIYRNNQIYYHRNLTANQAHEELKDNLDQMLTGLKTRYGTIVPDEVDAPFLRSAAGRARTYAEFTASVHAALQPLLERQRAGRMSRSDLRAYVAVQNQVIRWAYFFWYSNVDYDEFGWKQKLLDSTNSSVWDMSNTILGNARLQGNPRTFVCSISSVMLMSTLYDLGFFDRSHEQAVSMMKVNVNFSGIDQDAQGGHAALLVKTADGKARFIDLVQGDNPSYQISDWKLINEGIPHQEMTITDNRGVSHKVSVTPLRLQQARGEEFDAVIKNVKGRALVSQGLADVKVMDHGLVLAQNLYDANDYEGASQAYAAVTRQADERIRSLRPLRGQFNDLLMSVQDNTTGKPIGISEVIERMTRDRNEAVMGQGNADLSGILDGMGKARAYFKEQKYREASAVASKLIAEIDRNVSTMTGSGITRVRQGQSSWRDEEGTPISGLFVVNRMTKTRTLAQTIQANAAIGEGAAALEDVTGNIEKANALLEQKKYQEASLAYASILQEIDGNIKSLTAKGVGTIPPELSTWQDDRGRKLGGQWPILELRRVRLEVSEFYQTSSRAAQVDRAMLSGIQQGKDKYGGIDLNAAHLKLEIEQRSSPVALSLPPEDLKLLSGIQGFVPRIIQITPAASLPVLNDLSAGLHSAESVR